MGELLRRARLALGRLTIASDGDLAARRLGERDGAVVAAGTGTIGVARRGDRFAKVDGWGALLGDAGSGFAIRRAGLERRAEARTAAADRGPAARGRAALCPLPDLTTRIYGAAVPTRAVAAFAVDVAVRPRSAMLRRWRS